MKKSHRARFKHADLGTTLGLSLDDPISLIKEIRAGLRIGIVNDLARLLGLPIQRVMRAMAISARTLARRKRARRLHKEESELLVRIVLMLRAALRLFSGDMARAALWISTANPVLANAAPLDLADTAPGYEAVRDLIGRIEHGVYS